ncbi:MAG: short-chain fatty acid transporter [Planctomycetes bacterium]|nr:short-chain fatty acid transporter [Planctomycetota bacterium]
MISRLGALCAKIFYHTCPDPFVIAILLTLFTAGLALLFGKGTGDGVTAQQTFDAWRDGTGGIWKLLSFAMQMCLILVTGHALAEAKPIRRALHNLAQRPNSPRQAVAIVAAAACGTALLNWGLALIVGAIMAREVGLAMGRKGVRVHYPLLAAAGYTGLLVWHGGLSGSAPLSVTSLTDASRVLLPSAVKLLGPSGVPLGDTLFSPLNVVVTGVLVLGVPLFFIALTPRRDDEIRSIEKFNVRRSNDEAAAAPTDLDESAGTLPDRLDRSWLVSLALAAPLAAAVLRFVWMAGGDAPAPIRVLHGLERIGLNEINATMLALGLILHASPRAYMAAAEEGARGCAAIIIQFPLYAGIMAMMDASGLTRQIAEYFVRIGNQTTIPLYSYVSACIIGMFIPSGGAQWSVQGPIALQAGADVGIGAGRMVMTIAYGDQIPNMLQPFWALPLLSITGVRARDIVGYTATVMLFAAAWIGLALLIF